MRTKIEETRLTCDCCGKDAFRKFGSIDLCFTCGPRVLARLFDTKEVVSEDTIKTAINHLKETCFDLKKRNANISLFNDIAKTFL